MTVISESLVIPFTIGDEEEFAFLNGVVKRLQPWMTTDLERYMSAIVAMFQPTLELTEEEGYDGEASYVSAWSRLMSPALCPYKYLGYLAQYVGVTIPAGATEAEARTLVENHAILSRGTLAAVETAIYANTKLTFNGHTLVERGVVLERKAEAGGEAAYQFGVSLPSAELLTTIRALETAVIEVSPAGIWPWFNIGGKYTWAEASKAWSTDTWSWPETTIKKP